MITNNQKVNLKVNDYPKSPKEWCLGIYDFKIDVDREKLMNLTLETFKDLGLIATKISTTEDGKHQLFTRGWAKLQKHGFGNIEWIYLAAHPHYNNNDDSYYLACLWCDLENPKKTRFALALDEGLVQNDPENYLDKIYLKYNNVLKAEYAFSTSIEWQKGACWYAFGVEYSSGGNKAPKWTKPQSEEIGNWANKYNFGKYTTGDFRDIYEINYIGPKHLSMDIGDGRQLCDMIGKELGWGAIKQLAENMYSWHLTTEEAQILRQQLAPTGRILALKKPGT
jgi:hypothetical protein